MAELINPGNYQDFTLEMLQTPTGIAKLNSILGQLAQNISGDSESVKIYQGVGTPEASVAAGVGSLYMRTDGGADTSVYRKESGSADTGWVAIKAPASLPLSVANGGTGADNSAVAQGYIPYMSATGVISWLAVGTSGQILKTQGAGANPAWTADINTSNVIFNYAGCYLSGNASFYVGTSANPTSPTKEYAHWHWNSTDTTEHPLITTKWVKIAGVSTVTVYARLRANTNGSIKVSIGAASGNATVSANDTLEWINFTVDVSGLSNGTAYDVTIAGYLSSSSGDGSLYSIVGLGS